MDANNTNIFISYRRIDGRDIARTIQLALEKRGYSNVFFDYSSMREGSFNTQIFTAIESCNDFLLVMSPQSMLRCGTEGDWVAIEIERAISIGCNIIPVAIDQPFTDWPDDFPRKLSILKRQQMLTLHTDEYFESSIDRLLEWLVSKPSESMVDQNEKLTLTVTVDETCELFIDGERIRKIKEGNTANLSQLKRGVTYKLTLKSLAHVGDVIERDYQFINPKSETDSISVSFKCVRAQTKVKLQQERLQRVKEKQLAYEKVGHQKRASLMYDKSYDEMNNEGMLPVSKNGKIGFLDESSWEVVPCIYDDASEYYCGYSTVRKDSQWFVIDKIGQVVSERPSDSPCIIAPEARYYIASQNGRFQIIPLGLSKVNVCQFETYDSVFCINGYSDLFWVRNSGMWEMRSFGDTPVPFQMRVCAVESRFCQRLSFCKIKSSDDEALSIIRWPPFSVKHSDTGRWGYLNSELRLTVPFVDDGCTQYCIDSNLVVIKTNEKMGIVDVESGKTILPIVYDLVFPYEMYGIDSLLFFVGDGCFPDEYEIDGDGNKTPCVGSLPFGEMLGVCNSKGELVVPNCYQLIQPYFGGKHKPFIVAHKLISLSIRYELSYNKRELWRQPTYDESRSEVHIYTIDGTLINKGAFSECNRLVEQAKRL